MAGDSEGPTFASASGSLLACGVILFGAMRNIPIVSLIVRAIVMGTVVSVCIRVMQSLIRESSEKKAE